MSIKSGFSYSLCGYARLEGYESGGVLRFPVEAYKEFCKRVGLAFPFDPPQVKDYQEVTPKLIHEVANDEGTEVINSVTVKDIRKMCTNGSPLAHVLAAFAEFYKEDEEKQTSKMLTAKLNISAKRNGWGNGNDNGMACTQAKAINAIFTEQGTGGRGAEKSLKVDINLLK